MDDQRFRLVLNIISNEQSIMSRTDQKAYTLMSILGVFMVFFIVYYRFLIVNPFILVMLVPYFLAAFVTIFALIQVIQPRFSNEPPASKEEPHAPDPTYFGGIVKFADGDEYYEFINRLRDDPEEGLKLLSRQVHTLAKINLRKNMALRRGILAFVIAIATELLMILSTFLMAGMNPRI